MRFTSTRLELHQPRRQVIVSCRRYTSGTLPAVFADASARLNSYLAGACNTGFSGPVGGPCTACVARQVQDFNWNCHLNGLRGGDVFRNSRGLRKLDMHRLSVKLHLVYGQRSFDKLRVETCIFIMGLFLI